MHIVLVNRYLFGSGMVRVYRIIEHKFYHQKAKAEPLGVVELKKQIERRQKIETA